MASAIKGAGEWNPKDLRVISRILVLVDSTRALEKAFNYIPTPASRAVPSR